ncbi:MAG: hypothetical protein ACXVY8_08245 [Gaiellaceae bacterium]
MSRRFLVELGLAGSIGFLVATRLSPSSSGLALLAEILFLAALVLLWLVQVLSAVLPPAPDFERLLLREPPPDRPVGQFERLRVALGTSSRTLTELRSSLRPFVYEVAAARLGRGQGLDLARMSARERELVTGDRTCEILRPPHELPAGEQSPGSWSQSDLEQLVTELETL